MRWTGFHLQTAMRMAAVAAMISGSAQTASATYITFENVWGSSVNFVNMGFWDVPHTIEIGELWSRDYGIKPPGAFLLDITKANPLPPGGIYTTPLIPWLPDSGFLFTGLGVGGDFGFTGVSDANPGHTIIVPGSVIYALWPSSDGTGVQPCPISEFCLRVIKITFHAGAPPFSFDGFFPPIDNDPVVNSVKARSVVPVKFSLGGDQGLNIFASGFPTSQQVACNGFAALDTIEETLAASQSGLKYDVLGEQYIYSWKTEKAWDNTCRQLVIRFTDGSLHIANFKF